MTSVPGNGNIRAGVHQPPDLAGAAGVQMERLAGQLDALKRNYCELLSGEHDDLLEALETCGQTLRRTAVTLRERQPGNSRG